MKPVETTRQRRCLYSVSFATSEWEDIPALSEYFLCASDMMHIVEKWNTLHQRRLRKPHLPYEPLEEAVFMTMEMYHG